MAASVASTWGPGFVVGAGRRPARFAGRQSADRAWRGLMQSGGMSGLASEFAPVAAQPARSPQSAQSPQLARSAPPMRRRFETGVPAKVPPVSPRARRLEHPAPGQVRVRPRVRRARARSAAYRVHGVPRHLRLTRRGRLLLLALVAVAVYSAFGLGRASAGATRAPARTSTVVVHAGDSLWSIASREFPNSDPRDVVGELKSINHLSASDLAVGQKLRLP